MTISINDSINITQHDNALLLCVITLNVVFYYYYAECRYAECRHAECHYAECRSALVGWSQTNSQILKLVEILLQKKNTLA